MDKELATCAVLCVWLGGKWKLHGGGARWCEDDDVAEP